LINFASLHNAKFGVFVRKLFPYILVANKHIVSLDLTSFLRYKIKRIKLYFLRRGDFNLSLKIIVDRHKLKAGVLFY